MAARKPAEDSVGGGAAGGRGLGRGVVMGTEQVSAHLPSTSCRPPGRMRSGDGLTPTDVLEAM